MSFVFYISVVFSLSLFWSSLTLTKNLIFMNLTLEKHFMKLKNYKKSKLYIKKLLIPDETILHYGLYMNNYSNFDISRSSFSGILPFQIIFWYFYLIISYIIVLIFRVGWRWGVVIPGVDGFDITPFQKFYLKYSSRYKNKKSAKF